MAIALVTKIEETCIFLTFPLTTRPWKSLMMAEITPAFLAESKSASMLHLSTATSGCLHEDLEFCFGLEAF